MVEAVLNLSCADLGWVFVGFSLLWWGR